MGLAILAACLLCISTGLTRIGVDALNPVLDCQDEPNALQDYVDHFQSVIAPESLAFWHSKVDYTNGGYKVEQGYKHLVEQSRLVWLFSHAHLSGFTVDGYDNLKAARNGVDFLLWRMLDTYYGGFYWSTDELGNVVDDGKYMYGESFALYSLATYYRATYDERAKVAALELLDVLIAHASENTSKMGGYYENFKRDWTLLTSGGGPVSPYNTKTANFILHWMESLTSAVIAFNDDTARTALADTLDKYVVAFFTPDPENAVWEASLQGDLVQSAKDSDGHLVEYGWLRIEAEQALGRELSWDIFDIYFQYVADRIDPLAKGVHDSQGGFMWWAQMEFVSAMSVDKVMRGSVEEQYLLRELLDYVVCKFIDPADSIFYWSLTRDGFVLDGTKANKWKVGYHAFRGVTKLVDAFSGPLSK